MTDTPELIAAQARATIAKAKLNGTVAALKTRMDPRSLAKDATEGLVDRGTQAAQAGAETIRRNPGIAAGVAAVAVAFLARHRIAAVFRRPKRNLVD